MDIDEYAGAELVVADQQMYRDISDKTNKDYEQKMVGQFGWDNFLSHINSQRSTDYSRWPPPGNGQITIRLLKLFIIIKAKYGNNNSIGFNATRNGLPLGPGSVDAENHALLKYYTRKSVTNPEYPNYMMSAEYQSFYSGLGISGHKLHKKNITQKQLQPFYYNDVGEMIKLSYELNFIRKFDSKIGIWFRGWISLAFCMMLRGDELIQLKFRHLRFGKDKDLDEALLFTFVDRKSLAAYGKDAVTFNIYPNPHEPYINAFKFIQEYYELLEKLPSHSLDDDDYIFPNMTKNMFKIGRQGTTKYFREILKEMAEKCQLDFRLYANHSLRHGGARFKLIYSQFPLNIDQIRYLAGWTNRDSMETVGSDYSFSKVYT